MANISLYVSGQTELNDVNEFFQKNLMNAGENPVAFFDGVFYESHQERVGNIVSQDYLIYSDKAVYLWARGTNKDYLDRFNLGTVSVNSRNKDSDFATLNLKIRREEKEPVYVIFDMVEIREAELITTLHTVIESSIEDALGLNYRKEIPDAIAMRVLNAGRNICPQQSITLAFSQGSAPRQESSIGYGQDLLEQYKASIGYPSQDEASEEYASHQRKGGVPGRSGQSSHGNSAADALKGLENILPADPAALKRITSSIKDMVGEAPFKLRDQVMKDLQHVPGDVATVLTALNELLANIAGNPQAERFVMTAITTAVRNDGVLGSIGKMLKLTTGFGSGGGKKQPSRAASGNDRQDRDDGASRGDRRSPFDDDDSSTIRRKKISIREDSASGGSGMFSSDQADDSGLPLPGERSRRNDVSGDDADDGVKRRKISIKADDGSTSSALLKDMMTMDTPPGQAPPAPIPEKEGAIGDGESAVPEVRRKKIKIVADAGDRPLAASLSEPAGKDELMAALSSAEEDRPVQRKKIAIVSDKSENDDPAISEEMLAGALGEMPVRSGGSEVYTTIESDSELREAHAFESQGATENPEVPGESGAGGDEPPAGEQPVKRTIKIKSTQ